VLAGVDDLVRPLRVIIFSGRRKGLAGSSARGSPVARSRAISRLQPRSRRTADRAR
jgi:hypothetical protein